MIRVDALVKRRGPHEILRGISLEVGSGEVAAVIGPSGSGKSTFLRCLNGLERFEGGRVRIGELELTPATHPRRDVQVLRRVRRRVGMVFQQFNLFPHLSVLGNLIEAPLRVAGEPREQAVARAERLLDRMGLRPRIDAYPRALSGGEQQRVAIARALLMQPEAMLFDEPTSALDPVMAGEVLDVMEDLARDGQTMVVVTHSMGFARSAATRVYVFADGRIAEQGLPDQVLGDPRHEVTRAFLAEARRERRPGR